MRKQDVRIDTYTPAVPGASTAMQISHLPSGKVVSGMGCSYHHIKEELITELIKAINEEEKNE